MTALLLGLACSWGSAALAQSRATSADITGLVTDQSNAIISGVRIAVTNLETSVERSVTSQADGRFEVPVLPPGSYRVRLEQKGFVTHVIDKLELTLGATVDLRVVMRLAPIAEEVSVAPRSAIETRRAGVATVIGQSQISSLPINGRNFISFSQLSAGAGPDRMPIQGASATSGLSFSGQHARSNNITVDGVDNNDETVGSVRATFSQEAVREFQVLTQSYAAEFGKASAGVVNIVTKSGTNTLGGTFFGYFRDDALNAKEHFEAFDPAGNRLDQSKAPYSQRQFGVVVGGPLVKNRTFFFGSTERLDTTANNFVTIDDTTPVIVFGTNVGTPAALLRRAGFPVDTGHVPYDVRSQQILAKVDHHLRPTQILTVRYNFGDGFNGNTEAWGGLTAESRGASLDSRDHMFAASHTAVISSRLVNELRFQVADRKQSVLSLDPTCDGECNDVDEGGPTVEIAGFATVGRNRVTPQLRNNIRYQLVDTISYQRGSQLWKAGVDFNTIDHRGGGLPLHFGGRYVFSGLPAIPGLLPAPINAIQAFALGLPAAYAQGFGNHDTTYLVNDLSVFGQHQWRAASGVTVELGVRYQAQFWEDRTYTIPAHEPYTIPADRNNIAPRLGLAWDIGGAHTTVVRAAYGLYYDNVISGTVGIAGVINGAPDGVRTLVQRIPASLPAWNAPGRQIPEPLTSYPSLVIAIDPGLETSYAHHGSIGVERALGADRTISVNYLQVRGLQHLGSIDFNPIVPSLGAGRRPNDIGEVAGSSTSVLQYTSFGDTWYRALSFSMTQRLWRRLQFVASYVLSKAEDNTSDFQSSFLPQDNGQGRDQANPDGLPIGFRPESERGPSQQDQRHRFVFSGSYTMHGGIDVAAIVTVASGVPYNILAGVDLNGDGDGGGFATDRARTVPADPSTAVGRNAERLPSESTVDLRVSKKWRLRGRSTIEPIFEIFNLFNRVNYTDVNAVFGVGAYPTAPSPTFGQFQRAGPPRQAQLAVRVAF